jgi:hypothetical protein
VTFDDAARAPEEVTRSSFDPDRACDEAVLCLRRSWPAPDDPIAISDDAPRRSTVRSAPSTVPRDARRFDRDARRIVAKLDDSP